MAAEDFGDKTHEATPYRRQQAREEGQVVRSQDLASAGLLIAGLLVLWYFSSGLADFLGRLTTRPSGRRSLAEHRSRRRPSTTWLRRRCATGDRPCCRCSACWCSAAILTHMGQFGFLYLPQKLALDWQRINPLQNCAAHLLADQRRPPRLRPAQGAAHRRRRRLEPVGRARPADESVRANRRPRSPRICCSVLLWTSLKIGGALAVLALFDYGYQYWKHEQDLRMTTQELKEEIKTQQGDPQIAARRKQIQRQMVLHRLSTTIPKADVIVTNPTRAGRSPCNTTPRKWPPRS